MRVAVTGASGRLGSSLVPALQAAGHDVMPVARGPDGADLERPGSAAVLRRLPRLDWVVHLAAWTDVEGCEREPARAQTMNAAFCAALAREAALARCRFLQVSTDYVFDGSTGHYTEDAPTHPVNAYGRAKLDGERAVLAAAPDALVARVSCLFGARHRQDFLGSSLEALRAGQRVRAAADVRCTPTWVGDAARQVCALIGADAEGIFHVAGAEALSRSRMLQVACAEVGLSDALVEPVAQRDLAWRARRPADSSLATGKVARHAKPLFFRDALHGALAP